MVPQPLFGGFLQPFAPSSETKDHADDHAARWQPAPVCQSRDGGRGGRRDRARPCQGRARREAERRGQGPRLPHHHRRQAGDRHQDPQGRAGAAAPRRRARAGRGGAGAVPRHADHLRPGDGERLLLRLPPRGAFHARRFRQDRAAHEGDRRPRRADHARGVGARPGGRLLQAAWRDVQGRVGRLHPQGRGDLDLQAGQAGSTCARARTCPRPASSARPSS